MTRIKFIVGVCSGLVASSTMSAFGMLDPAALHGDAIEGTRDISLRAKTMLNFADRIYDKCFSVPNALCLGGTSQIITANAVPEGLSAWFTFDEIYPVDQTGNGNHMHRAPRSGPPHNGKGASAAFVNGASGTIRSSSTLESSEFTGLLDVPFGRLDRLLSTDASQTPTILLYPKTRKLSIRVTTTDSTSEGIPSLGALPLRRWTHIAVTASESRLKLFVNGVKDNEIALRGVVVSNSGDIVVGSTMENSGFEGYIDELRFYSRALPEGEVASLTAGGLTGIADTEFVFQGCAGCTFEMALHFNICGEPAAHLCSLRELYQGAIHIARVNGLLAGGQDIWHSEMSSSDVAAGEKRLALCCRVPGLPAPPQRLVASVA
ncbi:concanavalin A-like lectin/glucanase family protein [Toxoplasma gondii VAND]|uniref:Concanavalin A-like lectin/glucanase family protein n=1 Tax=Toxoplasma gondii VAND TaxID=933077 RepID=A0A086PXX6_TOXGO|nr:concanavalin A-like lectin/glucanase family protein [Toxoplasma gondii VAND]